MGIYAKKQEKIKGLFQANFLPKQVAVFFLYLEDENFIIDLSTFFRGGMSFVFISAQFMLLPTLL